jgi:ribosomal-protein-alanine N-acetyltransferase
MIITSDGPTAAGPDADSSTAIHRRDIGECNRKGIMSFPHSTAEPSPSTPRFAAMGHPRDHADVEHLDNHTTPAELGAVVPPYTRPLETARTRLRPYRAEDEDDFVNLFQDPDVSRYVGDGGDPGDPAEDRALFGRIFSLVYRENRFAVWAVERSGSFIGHAELKPSPSDDVDGWELVYMLTRPNWGTGLGGEVARAITRYGLIDLQLPAVWATIDHSNAASIKLITRLGYDLVTVRHEDATSVHIYRIQSSPVPPPPAAASDDGTDG